MKKNFTQHLGFTLVELLVSITIFGIMMISVMSIFLFSSQMSSRVELNRSMQENIKNVLEDIAENVRKNGIEGVLEDGGIDACSGSGASIIGTKLCLGGGIEYSIGYEDTSGVGSNWKRITDIVGDCGKLQNICRILKKDPVSSGYYPLTNSFVHFEDISFVVTNTDIPKVSINFTTRPPYNKGLSPDTIKSNTINIQTTISEKLIETH